MAAQLKIELRLKLVNAQITDLERQREENASKGNWTVVRALKDQLSREFIKQKLLESIINEDFIS